MPSFDETFPMPERFGPDSALQAPGSSCARVPAPDVPDADATRVAFRLRSALRFSELFLVPIVARTGDIPLCDPVRWDWVAQPLADALDRWLGAHVTRSVFARLYPYEWISSWPAEALRAHVLSTVPGRRPGTLTFMHEALDLPPDAPRLAFLCLVLTAKRGWPQLPAQGEGRFRKVVASALQGRENTPIVLSPGAPAHVMVDGLFAWLQELHQHAPIAGWMARPVAGADVVQIALTLGEGDSPVQFTVRMHQVGAAGLEQVLTLLAGLAPMLESPAGAS